MGFLASPVVTLGGSVTNFFAWGGMGGNGVMIFTGGHDPYSAADSDFSCFTDTR